MLVCTSLYVFWRVLFLVTGIGEPTQGAVPFLEESCDAWRKDEVRGWFPRLDPVLWVSFSALTLLFGWQEGHPVHTNNVLLYQVEEEYRGVSWLTHGHLAVKTQVMDICGLGLQCGWWICRLAPLFARMDEVKDTCLPTLSGKFLLCQGCYVSASVCWLICVFTQKYSQSHGWIL